VSLLAVAAAGALLALVNAWHCAAMCGVFAVRARPRLGAFLLGKAFTYLFLGTLAGALGAALGRAVTGAQTALAVLAALVLLLAGLQAWRGPRAGSEPPRWLASVSRLVGAVRPRGRFARGALVGALPCGLVYVALAQGLALGRPLAGAVFMTAFGLGTGPTLGLTALLADRARTRLDARALRVAAGALLVLSSALVVLRAHGVPCHPFP